jgi:ketosteroid isomerase-like protein
VTSPIIRAQLEAMNQRFYDAFGARDLDAMIACWASTDEIACVHPGSTWIRGWESVRDTWEVIMSGTGPIAIDVEVIEVVICDPVAWVTCVERVRAAGAPADHASEVAATNMFVLDAQGWQMMLHHASAVIA